VTRPWRPSKEQLAEAAGRTVPDVLRRGLDVLFCGINPGLYSGAVGHHFARPGNRFWPALAAAGFTPERLGPFEEARLPELGLGITNLVMRATATADAIRPEELRLGAAEVARKAALCEPRFVAFLGLGAYRVAFGRRDARVGPQDEPLAAACVWLLPNPSGLNAHWPPEQLAGAFAELRAEIRSR
jgi:double-stranded uracil-DNA glycosylase